MDLPLLLDIAKSFCFSGFHTKSKKIHNLKIKNNYSFLTNIDITIIKSYLISTELSLNSIKPYENHSTYILCQNNILNSQFQDIVKLYNQKYEEYNNKNKIIRKPEELVVKIYLINYPKIQITKRTSESNITLVFERIPINNHFLKFNFLNDIQYCNPIIIKLKIKTISFELLLQKYHNLKNKQLYNNMILNQLPKIKLLYLENLQNHKINEINNWKSRDNALNKILEITEWICQEKYNLFKEDINLLSNIIINNTTNCELDLIIKTNIIILSFLEYE